eukprot:5173030-Pleurochrysis_carterae.AAC.2
MEPSRTTIPAAPSRSACKEACAAAVLGLKPATLHSSSMTAVKKQKVTRAAHVDLAKTTLAKTHSAAKGAAGLNPPQTSEVNGDEVEKS